MTQTDQIEDIRRRVQPFADDPVAWDLPTITAWTTYVREHALRDISTLLGVVTDLQKLHLSGS